MISKNFTESLDLDLVMRMGDKKRDGGEGGRRCYHPYPYCNIWSGIYSFELP